MELVILVLVLALAQYLYFCMLTGAARRKYNLPAPAVTGHPVFERYYRVQMNTLEQLVVFVPALWIFFTLFERLGWSGGELAAALGVPWLLGRAIYARNYVRDPESRRIGFLLSVVPSVLLLIGSGVALFIAISG